MNMLKENQSAEKDLTIASSGLFLYIYISNKKIDKKEYFGKPNFYMN